MELRNLTKEEVEKKINDHKVWLEDVYATIEKNETDNYEACLKKRTFNFDKLSEELANDPRRADFSNVKFTADNFDKYVFSCTDLSGANFKGADFTDESLKNEDILDYVHLNYADLSDVKIPNEKWKIFGCEFRHTNLKGMPQEQIDRIKDSECDLEGATTDNGVCKSVLVPFGSSQSLPNDYISMKFYGVPNYANCEHLIYTNVPFESKIVTDESKEELKSQGYDVEKGRFLKFNEGEKVSLRSGKDRIEVDALEFSKACCEAYLGKEKVEPKTVSNENKIWFIKFNPTSRAPQHAIDFISIEGVREFDRLLISQKALAKETKAMVPNDYGIDANSDMIGRCQHFVLSSTFSKVSTEPHMGDSYPTYFFSERDEAAKGVVVVTPFMMMDFDDKSKFEIGEPYNLRTMTNLVETIQEEQNKARIQYYKDLSKANGIVPPNMSDKDLTKLAEENMILIQTPWQLKALNGEYDEKSKANINKLASGIDCMNDENTLAVQGIAKNMGMLYYNTTDIAKQMEYIANDIRKEQGLPNDKPVPQIGDKNVDAMIQLYNKEVLGIEKVVVQENAKTTTTEQAKEKESQEKKFRFVKSKELKDGENRLAYVIEKWAFDNNIRNKKGYLLTFNRKAKDVRASFDMLVKQAKAQGFVVTKNSSLKKPAKPKAPSKDDGMNM